MADKQHSALTSVHRLAHVSATDPGAVGAYHGWVDTSVSPFALKIRNAGNTAWDDVGAAGGVDALADLTDVDLSGLSDGDVLVYDAGSSTWVTAPMPTNGADGADGVGVPTGGTTGQVLAKASNSDFDTAWVTPAGGGGGGVSDLDDLGDVSITTPTAGQVLKYDGSVWKNDTDSTGGGGIVLSPADPSGTPTLASGETQGWFNSTTRYLWIWDGTAWLKSADPFQQVLTFPTISALWAAYEVFRVTGLNDGDAIASISDTGGVRAAATQGTSGFRPIYRAGAVNGKAAMEMNTGFRLALPDMSALTAGHGFFIMKVDSDPDATCNNEMEHTGSDSALSHYPYGDGDVYSAFGTTARKTVGNPASSMASWCCVEIISTATEWTFKLNGSTVYTTGSNTVGFTSTPVLGSSAGVGFKGKIAAFYMFDAKITGADRTALANYINDTFGIII